jgi:hypothetical protein
VRSAETVGEIKGTPLPVETYKEEVKSRRN